MDRAIEESAPDQKHDSIEAEHPIYTRKAGTLNRVAEQPPPTIATGGSPSPAPWVPIETTGSPDPSRAAAGEFDLPAVQPAADLPRGTLKARWVLLVFGATLLFYWLFANRVVLYSSPPSGDQPFYLMVTMSIVQDGDFNLTNNYANRDEDKFYALAPHPPDFVGQGAPYPLPPHNGFSTARPPTEQYNFHWPGLSLLVAPAWVIGGLFNLWWPATIYFMCIIGALLATNIFLLAHELTGRAWIAVAVWAALTFSNPLMSYSYLIFSELSCGLCLLYAFRRLALGWGANGPVRLLLIGLSIAYIPWLAWRCAPISFGLALYAAVQWWRYYRIRRPAASTIQQTEGPRKVVTLPRLILQSIWIVAPMAVSVALLAWYNIFLFGSFFPNNQVPERSGPIFFWPWQGREELTHFVSAGYGLLFDRMFGLLPFAPVYLLAVVGIIAMFQSARRSDRRLLFAMSVTVLPYLAIIMAFYYWNGLWNPPARFQTTLVPLLAAPLAFSLVACSSWLYRILYGVLALWGFVMMSIMVADPRRLWPLNAPYQWLAQAGDLLHAAPPPVTIDLWSRLPAVDPLVERTLPLNTAWVTLASLAVIILGYALMRHWRHAQDTRKLPFAAQGATWAVALAIVGASWYFTNYVYIQHSTTLTEVQSIQANTKLSFPQGIEYLDGKVYVTDYEGGAVGVYDLAAGMYSPLHVTSQGADVQLAKPGDIKAGPNGDLYLLNNGPAEDALFVIKPDGSLVRKIALDGKTPVASGLQIRPDGTIYVSDVGGGSVWKYGPNGGSPLAQYRGKGDGFDNILGLLIRPDGKIYAAESTTKLVQELDSDGKYLRSFSIGCSPFYMASTGDWLDVTCPNGGIYSVNLKTGDIQRTMYNPESATAPGDPVGITYGPDGKLYLEDGSNLRVYQVQH